MATVVQSLGSLADWSTSWTASATYGSLTLYDKYAYDYATLYKTQPNIRTCVDFLARNIAQLGLHVFRRVSDTDRQRLYDHELAQIIAKPNPYSSRYRWIAALISDMGIYDNAFWLKMPWNDRMALLRVPPDIVSVSGGLAPTAYVVSLGTQVIKPRPEQIVHFRGYNPESSVQGLSPLETLRRVLAEEYASGEYREYYWRNATRASGFIERPATAPEWSDASRNRFTAEFSELYAGGANSGKTPVLEDGMTWKQAGFSAQESEYLLGRKLTREECARAYHIPLPMVGILDHATFANIKEQHKQLYQDCLGPWLRMIEEEIQLQIFPDLSDTEDIYIEFNIAEKLAGSFEEQTQALQSAIGRPWMTANEGRARLNLPSMNGNAEQLVTPLNVLVGGQASPRDSAPKMLEFKADGDGAIDPTLPELRQRHIEKWLSVLAAYFRRQGRAILPRVNDQAGIETVWIDGERWDRELGDDIFALNAATATVWAEHVSGLMESDLDTERMAEYLRTNADYSAQNINEATRLGLATALVAQVPKDAAKGLFEQAATTRAQEIATSKVTSMANFGAHEGAKQSRVLKTKTWHINSNNPREAHAAMAGETVPITSRFSNGMMWPGDPAGGAENNANCQCSVTFGRE